MSIKESLEKIKPFYPLFLSVVVACVFFTLGRISATEREGEPLKITYESRNQVGSAISSLASSSSKSKVSTEEAIPTDGPVIGSKSGKKYYFPWCGTVKRILPQNQVHFSSIEEAKASGFTPGGNCKGLK